MARSSVPATTPLADRPSFLLSQIGAHAASRFAALLEPFALTPRHFGVVSVLVAHRGLSQQQLGEVLDIHRNSMVALLDDLEREGLVERQPSRADRRANALSPTKAGIAAIKRANVVLDELDNELLHGLSASRRRVLVALLSEIVGENDLRTGIHPSLRT